MMGNVYAGVIALKGYLKMKGYRVALVCCVVSEGECAEVI